MCFAAVSTSPHTHWDPHPQRPVFFCLCGYCGYGPPVAEAHVAPLLGHPRGQRSCVFLPRCRAAPALRVRLAPHVIVRGNDAASASFTKRAAAYPLAFADALAAALADGGWRRALSDRFRASGELFKRKA